MAANPPEKPDIFLEDWRACLHAHFIHVIREKDEKNEASLRQVLLTVGFDDPTLAEIRAQYSPPGESTMAATLPAVDVPNAVVAPIASPTEPPESTVSTVSNPPPEPENPAPSTSESPLLMPKQDPPKQLSLF